MLVLNKADLLDEPARQELRLRHPEAVLLSGATGEGLEELVERIERELRHTLCPLELLVPYANGSSLAELHEVAGEHCPPRHPRGRSRPRPRPRPPGCAVRAVRGGLRTRPAGAGRVLGVGGATSERLIIVRPQ